LRIIAHLVKKTVGLGSISKSGKPVSAVAGLFFLGDVNKKAVSGTVRFLFGLIFRQGLGRLF
jgi:hypothetical protein